jgi:hypothetical protein
MGPRFGGLGFVGSGKEGGSRERGSNSCSAAQTPRLWTTAWTWGRTTRRSSALGTWAWWGEQPLRCAVRVSRPLGGHAHAPELERRGAPPQYQSPTAPQPPPPPQPPQPPHPRHYRYFILLNSSVKGPFFPSWTPPGWHWAHAYLARMGGDVHAVGSSLVCLPEADAGAPAGGAAGRRARGARRGGAADL